jgi:hypothetical protein
MFQDSVVTLSFSGILVGVHNDTPEDPLLEHTCLMSRVKESLPRDATLVDLDNNVIVRDAWLKCAGDVNNTACGGALQTDLLPSER